MDKIYLLIIDGGADHAIMCLDGLTPFEYAYTPTLDYIAKRGRQSLITLINDELIPPESDSGTMALLSYDPLKYYKGRGPLEAFGAGLIKDGLYNSAFRINFASYDGSILNRRTARGLSNKELQALTNAINKNISLLDISGSTFELISYRHHRGIISFRNKQIPLSGNVSFTDPGFAKYGFFGINKPKEENLSPLECKPLDSSYGAIFTAELINEFCARAHSLLENHPINVERVKNGKLSANYLLFRDGGELPIDMPNFLRKFEKTLSMYGQLSAEEAIASLIGAEFHYARFDEKENPSGVREYLNDLSDTLLNDNSDIVFAHLKGPDEPGHDNQPFEKVKSIEELDKYLFNPLMERIDDSDVIIVTCDHATPCELQLHSNDKVPIAICGKNIIPDATVSFGEKYARCGELEVNNALQVLPYVIK